MAVLDCINGGLTVQDIQASANCSGHVFRVKVDCLDGCLSTSLQQSGRHPRMVENSGIGLQGVLLQGLLSF